MKLVVKDVEIDDDFSKAIWLDRPELADFSESKFNCRVKCQPVGQLTPRAPKPPPATPAVIGAKQQQEAAEEADEPEEVPETSESSSFPVIWLMFPAAFLIAAVIYRKLGVRGLARLFTRLFRNKRKTAE